MKTRVTILMLGLASFVFCPSPRFLRGQSQAPDVSDPKFSVFVYDVVSVKPDDPIQRVPGGVVSYGVVDTADGLVMQHAPFSILIGMAYRAEHLQFSGAPGWLTNERYHIEAKMSPEVIEAFNKLTPTDQKLARRHMLQQLVKDYLKLSVHMEPKEVTVYELQAAKNGRRLKEVTDPAIPDQGLMVTGGSGNTRIFTGRGTHIGSILNQLGYTVGKPVYNKTGLLGRYNFELRFSPEGTAMAVPSTTAGDVSAPSPSDAPDIMTAIQEQLGLKLVPAKGMMDVLVIDHVERPAMN